MASATLRYTMDKPMRKFQIVQRPKPIPARLGQTGKYRFFVVTNRRQRAMLQLILESVDFLHKELDADVLVRIYGSGEYPYSTRAALLGRFCFEMPVASMQAPCFNTNLQGDR